MQTTIIINNTQTCTFLDLHILEVFYTPNNNGPYMKIDESRAIILKGSIKGKIGTFEADYKVIKKQCTITVEN